MQAKFIGVPGEPAHQELVMYGQVFPLGEWVEVMYAQGKRKLANHPHFEAQMGPEDEVTDVEVKNEFAGAMSGALAQVEAQQPDMPVPPVVMPPAAEPEHQHSAAAVVAVIEAPPPADVPAPTTAPQHGRGQGRR